MVEMWERRIEFHLLAPISHIFRNSHPAMKEMEVPQVPAWAEANKPRVMDFLAILDGDLKDRRFVAGDRYTVADITGLVVHRFHEARQARGAGNAEQSQALACRGCRRGRARKPENLQA